MSEKYYYSNEEDFANVADAIRAKGGTTEKLHFPNDFITAIAAIETAPKVDLGQYNLESKTVSSLSPTSSQIITPSSGYYGLSQVIVPAIPTTYADTSGTTAVASNILAGKKVIGANRTTITGAMANNGAVNDHIDSAHNIYTIPEGYHNGKGTVTGISTSDADATSSDILAGKTAYVKDVKVTGAIATKTATDLTASGATVTVPSGYYAEDTTKSIAITTQATPTITVDSSGLITASATQTAGYVASSQKSATKQLTTQAATTITPGTSNKTAVTSGKYTTGSIVVKGDSNLKAANIKKGTSIFGITGTYDNSENIVYEEINVTIKEGDILIPLSHTRKNILSIWGTASFNFTYGGTRYRDNLEINYQYFEDEEYINCIFLRYDRDAKEYDFGHILDLDWVNGTTNITINFPSTLFDNYLYQTPYDATFYIRYSTTD